VQGEQLGLKLAAKVADGWNCASVSPQEFARKRSILMDHAGMGRSIETSVCLNLNLVGRGTDEARQRATAQALRYRDVESISGGVDEIVESVGAYVERDLDWLLLRLIPPFDSYTLERFASEVIPVFC
jgi:alkanesulfonate monooxygenase SsuD/methylene tetrahydromethanopterin reductase-like flavin-dependent oxidoreductase (luciferase family)